MEQRWIENPNDLKLVLAAYSAAQSAGHVEFLSGAGGFSGAMFWRLETAAGPLCLRRWPREHPSPEGLTLIHRVLEDVAKSGLDVVPAPLKTNDDGSYVHQGGHLWELAPWMPGQADYRQSPSDAKLVSALETLARFHRAAESCSLGQAARGPSPGLSERLENLQSLGSGELDELTRRLSGGAGWTQFVVEARRVVDLYPMTASRVRAALEDCNNVEVPLQPCIRDIWHQHVLFMGTSVSGLVDFGSMRVETVAGDVARLLGSMAADDEQKWELGLAAYQQIRPLADAELMLVGALDKSGVLLSGFSWIRWICREGRQFENPEMIVQRMREIVDRLAHLAEDV